MATLLEPPALVSVGAVLVAVGGALYYGLRPALKGPLPTVTSERDEVWGTEDPPPPPKRPYVYPADRTVAVESPAVEVSEEREPAKPTNEADEEEEISLADLFRPRRRPPPPQPPEPPDATPQS